MSPDDQHSVWQPAFNDNLYLHELGHVLGAIHPTDNVEDHQGNYSVSNSAGGVLCKHPSCATEDILEIVGERYPTLEPAYVAASDIIDEIPDTPYFPDLSDVNDDIFPTELYVWETSFSDDNHDRIRNLNFDWRDDDIGPPSNLSATARGVQIGDGGP